MDNKEYQNSDFVKFIKAVAAVNEEDKHPECKNQAYAALCDLMDKKVPLDSFAELGWEFTFSDDEFAPWGYVYHDTYSIFYQEKFIDEEELVYTDDNPYGAVYFRLSKHGLELLPDIVIGKELTFDTVCNVFEGNLSATIREGRLWEHQTIIECQADTFMLTFSLTDGILDAVDYYAIGAPAK